MGLQIEDALVCLFTLWLFASEHNFRFAVRITDESWISL